MGAVLGIVGPIYAAVGLGYWLVRRGWFGAADMRVFGQYVLNVALPALLFQAVAGRDLAQVLRADYLAVYLAGGLATIAVAFMWFSLTAADAGRRAVAVMGAACPNSGFVGYPVLLLVLPDWAGVVLALNMLVENIVLIPICLMLMDLSRDAPRAGPGRRLAAILWGVARRPMVIGLALGLAVSLSGLTIPAAAARFFDMLAGSAAALSLIAIGGSLAGLPLRGNRALAAQIAAAKLILNPALTWAAAAGLAALGWVVLPPELFLAAVLSTAMPIFGIYTVLAQEVGREGLASIAMLMATGAGFVTLAGVLFWLV